MQGKNEATTLTEAQNYANRTGFTIHVWRVCNRMHKFLRYEYWPATWEQARYFGAKPDHIITPVTGKEQPA